MFVEGLRDMGVDSEMGNQDMVVLFRTLDRNGGGQLQLAELSSAIKYVLDPNPKRFANDKNLSAGMIKRINALQGTGDGLENPVQQLRDGQVAWVEDVRKPLSLTEPILQRVHTERHIATLTHAFAALRLFPEELGSPSASVPTFGTGSAAEVDRRETFYFDSDTPAAHGTEEAVLAAAAAAIAAVDSVVLGEAVNAFCITRPPGHHAEADRAMGFCFLNNAALAAVHALESRETATCPHECGAQLKHLTTECRASPLPPAFAGPQMRLGFLGLLS